MQFLTKTMTFDLTFENDVSMKVQWCELDSWIMVWDEQNSNCVVMLQFRKSNTNCGMADIARKRFENIAFLEGYCYHSLEDSTGHHFVSEHPGAMEGACSCSVRRKAQKFNLQIVCFLLLKYSFTYLNLGIGSMKKIHHLDFSIC